MLLEENVKEFIDRIKNKKIQINRIVIYKSKSKIKNKINEKNIDDFYWKDEIKKQDVIYPYICEIEEMPFLDKQNVNMPYIKSYTDSTWEAFRSCLQYSEYRELSYIDFILLISNL